MDWGSSISTAMGAVIGVAATLLADRAHWKRDTADRAQADLKALYVSLLTAMSHARSEIWAAHTASLPANSALTSAARDALKDHDVFSRLNEMLLCAPPDIADLAFEAGRRLIDYRDVAVNTEGGDAQASEVETARNAYLAARTDLIEAMRRSLGQLRA
jgi:hypothetical protein